MRKQRLWKAGDYAAVNAEHAKQYGLSSQMIDVVCVTADRYLVSARGKEAWVPHEVVGAPDDFGIIDDGAYFMGAASDEAFEKLIGYKLEPRGTLRSENPPHLTMARVVHGWAVSLAQSEVRARKLGIAEEDRAEHRRVIEAMHAVIMVEMDRYRVEFDRYLAERDGEG